MATKIYSYHVQPVTRDNPQNEYMWQQLRASKTYYNVLIDIELAKRAEYRAIRSSLCPELEAMEAQETTLEGELNTLVEQLQGERKSARTRVKNPNLQASIKAAKEALATLRCSIKALRTQVSPFQIPTGEMTTGKNPKPKMRHATLPELEAMPPSVQVDFSRRVIALEVRTNDQVKAARAASSLYWKNYLRVEDAIQDAKKSKVDPSHKGFRGTGTIGGQIQGGLSTAEVYSDNVHLRITRPPNNTWSNGAHWRHAHVPCQLRVGSDDHGKPLWLELSLHLDRPLPPGTIKEAYLKIIKIGLVQKYALKLTIVEADDCLRPNKRDDPVRSTLSVQCPGVCAINFGWRALRNGDVRVAYLVDTEGRQHEVTLPARVKEAFRLAERLQGFADTHFDTAQSVLRAYLADPSNLRPEWVAQAVENIHLWKAHGKLAMLATRLRQETIGDERGRALWAQWTRERLAAHQDLFGSFEEVTAYLPDVEPLTKLAWYLEVWRKKDKHLIQWAANQRQNCQDFRKNLFRCEGKSINSGTIQW